MSVRRAGLADVPVLARHRAAMFADMAPWPARALAAVERGTAAWLRRALPAGAFVGFVAEERGRIAAGGGLLVRRMMPRPGLPRGFLEAHVLSVFTVPDRRRRGHARAVMRAVVAWCRREGFARVTLHASRKGRPLYLDLGFEPREELVLRLRGRTAPPPAGRGGARSRSRTGAARRGESGAPRPSA